MASKIFASNLFGYYLLYPILVILFIPILVWFYIELQNLRARWKCRKQNIPYARLPSFAKAYLKKKRFDKIENDNFNGDGFAYGSILFNRFTISLSNPELVQIICNKEFTKFSTRRVFKMNDKILDNSLFFTNQEKWKRVRSIVSPAFSLGKLRKIKCSLDDTVKTMLKNIDKKMLNDPVMNLKDISGAFLMDTMIQIAFGAKIDSINDPNNKFVKNARRVFGDISMADIIFFTLAGVCPSLLKLLGIKLEPEALNYFTQCSIEIIQRKRKEMETKWAADYKSNNFIELILEVEHEANQLARENKSIPFKHISNDEIIVQCVEFFAIGYNTTTSMMSNVCYLLAKHPDKQEKLYQSIVKTLEQLSKESENKTNDPLQLITFDNLNRFEYLSATVNESLRLMTIAYIIERVASEDFRLETSDGKFWFDVCKDDVIRINIGHMHMDERNFTNAQQFIPERFLTTSTNENFNKSAYMPFGSGPRNCIARNFVYLQAKLGLIHLVLNYRLKIDPKIQVPIDFFHYFDSVMTHFVYLALDKRQSK